MQYLKSGDHELGILLAQVVSLVDDQIPLSNDKSELQNKSWDSITKVLSNYGRVIYNM